MTDRELLELAAKAAGMEITSWYESTDHPFVRYPKLPQLKPMCWMPLHDDGDALRLAVTLKMKVSVWDADVVVRDHVESINFSERIGHNSPCAATRRAIVRAAAEIGRMK